MRYGCSLVSLPSGWKGLVLTSLPLRDLWGQNRGLSPRRWLNSVD